MISFLVALALSAPLQNPPRPTADGKRVMVIYNRLVPEGQAIAEAYARYRGVPDNQVMRLSIGGEGGFYEDMNIAELDRNVITELRNRIRSLSHPIDYIVTVKGIPLRTWDGYHWSTDALISTMDMSLEKPDLNDLNTLTRRSNPYFGKRERFTKRKYGFYLVTRLDGYTWNDIRALITRSQSARGHRGVFLLDGYRGATNRALADLNQELERTGDLLRGKKLTVDAHMAPEFAKSDRPLAGYASWGSNDPRFNAAHYTALRFQPGAIAETFVSTSARTMRPTTGGQSLIADLIKGGVTGVKGYVAEPWTISLARPSILFERYASGYTLAESFYMASPLIGFRCTVIGDPLLAPYR